MKKSETLSYKVNNAIPILKISRISYQVAKRVASMSDCWREAFFKEATEGEYRSLTHYNHFMSFPAFGTAWPCGRAFICHRIGLVCSKCKIEQYFNVHTLYISKTGNRFMLYCKGCLTGKEWTKVNAGDQLTIF